MRNYIVRDMSSSKHATQSSISLNRTTVLTAVSNFGQVELNAKLVAMTESLIDGYQAMSQLNSEITQEYLPCEAEVDALYVDA